MIEIDCICCGAELNRREAFSPVLDRGICENCSKEIESFSATAPSAAEMFFDPRDPRDLF